MISFTCPCGRRVSAPAELAGKKVKCPKCLAVTRVPPPAVDVAAWELDLAGVGAGDQAGTSPAPPPSAAVAGPDGAGGSASPPLAGGVFDDDDFAIDFSPYVNPAAPALDDGPQDVGPEKATEPAAPWAPPGSPDLSSLLDPPVPVPPDVPFPRTRPEAPEVLTTPVAGPLPKPDRQPPPAPVVFPTRLKVTLVGIDIPFFELVGILLRIMLAAIPASILFTIILALFWMFVLACFGMLFRVFVG